MVRDFSHRRHTVQGSKIADRQLHRSDDLQHDRRCVGVHDFLRHPSDGVGERKVPVSSIKRSASIIRQTWGRQITATFGFFIVYLLAIIAAAIPAILLFLIAPAIGIVVGILLVGFALAVVQTLEGIFKAALYDFAVGAQPEGFDLRTLQTAYQAGLR